MKIVLLNGSARKGNTYACVEAFAEGAQSGNDVEIIATDGLNVSPCKGCEACGCEKGCVAKDDSNAVTDKLVAVDLIVFASPVYWWGVTAQLKTVIDKSYCKAALLKGKKVGLILVGGASTDDVEYELIRRQFAEMSAYNEWDFAFFKAYSAYGPNDLAADDAAMADMRELGAGYAE